MRGFIAIQGILLVVLLLLTGFLIKSKLPNKPPLNSTEEKVATQSAGPKYQTSTPSASPIASKTPVLQNTQAPVIDCTITASSDSLPPGMPHYFTVGLKDRIDPIKSVDWDIDSDDKVDYPNYSSWLSHIYKDPGNYNVRAKVTLTNGQKTSWCLKAVQVKYSDVSCTLVTSDTQAMTISTGKAPLRVCIGSGTTTDSVLDKDGIEGYLWDYNGDGNWDSSLVSYGSDCYTYTEPKNYNIRMQVKTKSGRSAICSTSINVTN